jgi:chromosomal replication initiation ATPase DnaA
MKLTQLGHMFSQDHTSIMYARDMVRTQLTLKDSNSYKTDIHNIINTL